MIPEWALKYKRKGTTIKESKGKYYLYKVTSKRVKGIAYPVCVHTYLGAITEEGFIEAKAVTFNIGVDKVIPITKLIDGKVKPNDKVILDNIYVISIKNNYYCGELTVDEIDVIKKYLNFDNYRVW